MSDEEKCKKQMRDEKKAFIREQIAPGRRSSIKRFLLSALRVLILALLFGAVSGLVFSMAGSYFNKFLSGSDERRVLFRETASPEAMKGSPTPEPSATPAPTPTPSPSEAPDKVLTGDDYIAGYQEVMNALRRLAERLQVSVVKVTNVQNGVDWFDNPAQEENAVSGLIIAEESGSFFVLASAEKIKDAENIRITFLKDETVEGELCGKDEDMDLAVIEVKKKVLSGKALKRVVPAELGDPYQIQKGGLVLALGNPTGYMYSMKCGTVIGDTMEQYITDNKLELFQTDWIRMGSGGGFIVNTDGQVLGMITAHFEEKLENNLCTAVNLGRLKSLLETLANKKTRPYFGVMVSDIPDDYKEALGIQDGIYVSQVKSGSPALEAGIQAGDVIVSLGKTDIVSVSNYASALSLLKEKQTVTVRIIRTSVAEKRERKLKAVIGAK